MLKDLSNQRPVVIAGLLVVIGLIIAVGFMLFGPEPTKPVEDFLLLGGPSNQQHIIHQAFIDEYGMNFVPGYEFLGTSDMLAYKPGGKESEVDYYGVDGAQFGSAECANLKAKYPDGLPTRTGEKLPILLCETAFTSPAGFYAKQEDWNELLRVGVTRLEGNAAFLPPENMTVIIAGVNRSTFWHNVCNVDGKIVLITRENETDSNSKPLSIITVDASGNILTQSPIENGSKVECLNIHRQMIIKYAASVSSGGKNALAVWAMYQPYNEDGTPNTRLIPGSSPTKDYEILYIAPSLKTLSANSGQQVGNSLLAVSQWAQNPFPAEVLAFGYVNAGISVAYNDVSEELRPAFMENVRAIYLYNTLNSEHEWACFSQRCVELYERMMKDDDFLKLYSKVTGFNIGYNYIPEPQTSWQISREQFGLINMVPNPPKEILNLLAESITK